MTVRYTCECPADWVACFCADCPRGVQIKVAARAKTERALRLLGNPMKGISANGEEQPR